MEYLVVGTIVRTVGLKGEVKVYPSTDFRDSRFKVGNHLFLSNGEEKIEVTIKSHKVNGECDNLTFKEFSSIDEVEKYVRYDLLVIKDRSFLKKDEYFHSDLEGMDVYFDNKTYIGKVSKVEEFAAYKTLRIKRENNKDVLIPFVNAFIKDVNLDSKVITIKYIDGLLWR